MKPNLSLHARELQLNRYPIRNNETLQAWDAGDEYLINEVHSTIALDPHRSVLILNDSFGALSCWFSTLAPVVSVSDSFVAQQACAANLTANQLPEITQLTSLDALPTQPQLVLMKLPKNQRLLEHQLCQLSQVLAADTPVIAADKAKEIHTSTLKTIETLLGDTRTSLAVKKARLVFCSPLGESRPTPEPKSWAVPEYQLSLTNLANVFSGEKLDIGARFFLEHLPKNQDNSTMIDLGCGNGVIGVQLARQNPSANILCVDESHMAAASARLNADANVAEPSRVATMVNDALTGIDSNSADWVLCNPPFHQQNAITDHIAWQMFRDALRVLKMGGKLRIIGNRHLGYHVKLKRLFGNVNTVATNNKFVILEAQKRTTRTTS
uniref:methyltransferase n=1 Tax=Thaumasiovibrio occultus TaxID=1891184 RepID=UPI000B350E79|nr:methyltransferase [Thaumasiovibrio occultus]